MFPFVWLDVHCVRYDVYLSSVLGGFVCFPDSVVGFRAFGKIPRSLQRANSSVFLPLSKSSVFILASPAGHCENELHDARTTVRLSAGARGRTFERAPRTIYDRRQRIVLDKVVGGVLVLV